MPDGGGVVASRRHEDRDDSDDDGDHDEHQAHPPVPLAGGHLALDLLALEPGLLAPLGLGQAASVVVRAASLVGSGHVCRTSSSSVGSASLPTEPRLRRVGAVPMLVPPSPRSAGVVAPARLMGEGHGHDRPRSGRQGGGAARERARSVLQDHGARLVRADRDHRGVGHVADDGLHPVREPGDPGCRHGQRGDHAHVPAGAHRDGARRGGHDARDGHLRELPVRDRGGSRVERVRHVLARRPRWGSRGPRRWA